MYLQMYMCTLYEQLTHTSEDAASILAASLGAAPSTHAVCAYRKKETKVIACSDRPIAEEAINAPDRSGNPAVTWCSS